MAQTFRRNVRFVFGAAVMVALGFGATQALAEPQTREPTRSCLPGYEPCYCDEEFYRCVKNIWECVCP